MRRPTDDLLSHALRAVFFMDITYAKKLCLGAIANIDNDTLRRISGYGESSSAYARPYRSYDDFGISVVQGESVDKVFLWDYS